MKQQGTHRSEDKLLEFAYGELPPDEAQSIAAHLQGCPRCSGALGTVQGVRRTMSLLEAEPAPAAGLDSLLAYAQQSARRAHAGPSPSRSPWRRWVFSLAGVGSLAVVVLVGTLVTKSMRLPQEMAEKRLSLERRTDAAPQAAAVATAAEGQMQAQAPAPAPAKPSASKDLEDARQEMPATNYFDARSDKRLQKLAATPPPPKGEAAPGEPPADEKRATRLDSIQQAQQPLPKPKPKPESKAQASDDRDYTQRTRMPAPAPQEIARAKKSVPRRLAGGWETSDGAGSGGPGSFGGRAAPPAGAISSAAPDEDRRGLSLGGSLGGTARPAVQGPERKADEAGAPEGSQLVAKSPAQPRDVPAAPSAEPAPSREAAAAMADREAAAAEAARESERAKQKEEADLDVRRLTAEAQLLRKEISATRDPVKLAPLLDRLCNVEIVLGYIQPTSCRRLEKEFASTPQGARARQLLDRQRSPPAPAVKY